MLEVPSHEGTCCYLVGIPKRCIHLFGTDFNRVIMQKRRTQICYCCEPEGRGTNGSLLLQNICGFPINFLFCRRKLTTSRHPFHLREQIEKKSQIYVRSEEHLKTTTVYLYETIVAFIIRIIKFKIH